MGSISLGSFHTLLVLACVALSQCPQKTEEGRRPVKKALLHCLHGCTFQNHCLVEQPIGEGQEKKVRTYTVDVSLIKITP